MEKPVRTGRWGKRGKAEADRLFGAGSNQPPHTNRTMNKNLTEIAFILDRSGSMKSCAVGAIAGFNQFLKTHQDQPGKARFTLVLFDDQYEVPCASLPIEEVTALDETIFLPRGMTALLDAIARTIDELGSRLAAEPEENRPGQVIVAILTDGLENASARFTWGDVSSRIKHQAEVYKWEFLFLGANQDAIATAAQMCIAAENAATIAGDIIGIRSSGRSLSRKSLALRKKGVGAPMSVQEEADLVAPLHCLAAEEDRKERGK
jgi:hypothetical protein